MLTHTAPSVLATIALVALPRVLPAQERGPSDTLAVAVRQNIVVLPVLGAAPETGAQFGGAILVTRQRPAAERTRASSVVGNAIRTSKGQTRIFLDTDLWSRGNRWRVATTASWQEFPLPYFGIGDSAPESAEEIYTPRGTDLGATLQQLIAPSFWLQAAVRRTETAIVRTEAGGALEPGTLTGSRGGRTVLATAGIVRDTRTNIFAPSGGHFAELTASVSDRALGSEFGFSRVRLDARTYYSLGGNHVLGMHLVAQGTAGTPPFDELALVGNGTSMRGYTRGRFRDRWLASAQAEYRSPLMWRIGAAAFAGAAVTAPAADALGRGRVLPTMGAGLRYRLNPATGSTVRVDYARGTRGESGLYVAFGEAF